MSRFICHSGSWADTEPGSGSTFSAESGDSESVGSAPPSPGVLALWQQLQLAAAGLESESGSESGSGSEHELEPGSSHRSTPPQSPPHPDELAAAATTNPEAGTFFNDALKQKIKVFGGLGAVLGVSAGLVYGLHKLIKGPSQPYVSARFPLASNRVKNILTYDLPQ